MSARTFDGDGDPAQLALFDMETGRSRLARGEQMRTKAREWVRHNHGTWMWMVCRATEAAEQKRRFSIARLAEEARYTKPVEGVDEYRINNDIRAPLARMLMDAVPSCRPYIEVRESKVDL